MFILRKISSDHVEMNFIVGKSYSLITESGNPNDFKRLSKSFWGKDTEVENTYGFICGEFEPLPLFKNQFNYIMTGDGKTFSNVTLK